MNMTKLRKLFRVFKGDLKMYRLVLKDKRTPSIAKFFLGLAIVYFIFPFDFIPDFIPILGQLDELIIIPLLISIALRLTPVEVINEYRIKASD